MRKLNARDLLLTVATFAITAIAIVACSSSPSSTGTSDSCTAGSTVACTCENGAAGSQVCGSPSCTCSQEDAATKDIDAGATTVDSGHEGNGGHIEDGAAPSSLYGACAVQGSFGWPCTNLSMIDPVSCTDPRFPFCFSGGQGAWCTADCGDAEFAVACAAEATGCAPTACNAKGYCK